MKIRLQLDEVDQLTPVTLTSGSGSRRKMEGWRDDETDVKFLILFYCFSLVLDLVKVPNEFQAPVTNFDDLCWPNIIVHIASSFIFMKLLPFTTFTEEESCECLEWNII